MFQEYRMDDDLKRIALDLSEKGDAGKLYKLIKRFIDIEDPFALNLYSTFSLTEFGESEEEFSKRSVKLKIQASENGIADASYWMGVNHLYGDDVPQSYKEATKYFERAISQGHTHTKFTFGFSLYYGTDGNPLDKVRGLALLEEAALEGSEGAKNELQVVRGET